MYVCVIAIYSLFVTVYDLSTLSVQICHPSGAAITGKMIKNSEVVMVEKCGHAMTMDRPRKCANLINQFINRVDRSSSIDL